MKGEVTGKIMRTTKITVNIQHSLIGTVYSLWKAAVLTLTPTPHGQDLY